MSGPEGGGGSNGRSQGGGGVSRVVLVGKGGGLMSGPREMGGVL